jgi:hypothetical protein
LIIPVLSLGALLIFLAMAAAAGFATGRAGASGPDPALAGLLVGVISGSALVVLLALMPGVEHRFQELTTLCPDTSSSNAGGFFSFNFGSPPPGAAIATPPPEAFATPPPGALAFSSGSVGMVGVLVGMVITILVGIGIAVGVAAVAALAGRATRAREMD